MIALNFPPPSYIGQTFSSNGLIYLWDGMSWNSVPGTTDIVVTPSIVSNTLTIDLSLGSIYVVNLNDDITTFTITGTPISNVYSMVLVFIADGTLRNVNWPTTFEWPGAVPPTITTTNGQKDVFSAFSIDRGETWEAFITGQDL